MSCCNSLTITPCSISISDALTLLGSVADGCGNFCDGSGSIGTPMPPSPLPQFASFITVEEDDVPRGTFTILNFIGDGLSDVIVTDVGGGQADILVDTPSLVRVTLAQAQALETAGDLKPSINYWIYDVGDGTGTVGATNAYAGIIIRAAKEDRFDQNGIFISRNIKTSLGIPLWSYGTSYSNSVPNAVENFNGIYLAAVAATSTTVQPAANAGEWTYITRDNNFYYVTEIQRCVFDVPTGQILERTDRNGNNIRLYGSATPGNNAIILSCFRWGRTSFKNNKISVNLTGIPSGTGDGYLGGTKVPASFNFRANALDGTFENNIIDIVNQFDFFCNVINNNTAANATLVTIKDNTFKSCRIYVSDKMNMRENDLFDSIITGNTYTNASDDHVFKCEGCFAIINNSSNTTGVIYDTTVRHCTGNSPFGIISGSVATGTPNVIKDNVGVGVFACVLKQGEITENEKIFIFGCHLHIGYILRNKVTTTDRNDTARFISQVRLFNEGSITDCEWTSHVAGITQKIFYGEISGNYGYIKKIKFDATQFINAKVGSSTLQLRATDIQLFFLNGCGIDGNSVSEGVYCSYTSTPQYIPVAGGATRSYNAINISTALNKAYVFLDITDKVGGTTLTIPYQYRHGGIFYIYWDTAISLTKTIDSIIIQGLDGPGSDATITALPYRGPWRFVNIINDPTNTLTFNLTSVTAPITGAQIARYGSTTSIVLSYAADFMEIIRNQSYYTVYNSNIVS